jgi:subtilase family serine protease
VAPYWNTADNALEYPAPGGVTLETVWNDSQTPATSQNSGGPAAGGGGPSAIWTKPFWQQNVTPADGWRDTPDISLSASNMNVPYTIYDTNSGGSSTDGGVDPLVALGGTSCSSPSLAGIFALLNQSIAKKNGSAPGLGNANPVLYALAKSVPGAFHDIATGTNAIPCTPGTDPQCPDSGAYAGYAAVAGYDEATGWGTIDANQFVNAWTALNPTTTNLAVGAASVALGAKVQLNATIASNVATPALTGTVSFSFVTYTEDGGTDDSWDLGDTPITATTTGGKAGGTATLTTAIPPGLSGNAQVVAIYNGDSHYLWSQSARTHVTVTGLTLAISPTSATVAPNASLTVTATGGVAPLTWSIVRDSTFDQNTFTGASITPAASGPTAVYTAGDTDGATVIQVLDADGQDAFLTITVAGAPIDAGADDAGAIADAGPILDAGAPDSDVVVPTDGGNPESSSSGSSGCSCLVAGSGANGTEGPGGAAAVGGVLFGLVSLSRRRRSRR